MWRRISNKLLIVKKRTGHKAQRSFCEVQGLILGSKEGGGEMREREEKGRNLEKLVVYTRARTPETCAYQATTGSLPVETHPHALTSSFSLCSQTHTLPHVNQQVPLYAWTQNSPTPPSV